MHNDYSGRRAVAILCSYDFIIEQAKRSYVSQRGIHVRCAKGIPSDAILIGSFTEDATRTAYLVFEHYSFDKIGEHASCPYFAVEHVRIREYDNKVIRFLEWVISKANEFGIR